jgi:hypothetical protein
VVPSRGKIFGDQSNVVGVDAEVGCRVEREDERQQAGRGDHRTGSAGNRVDPARQCIREQIVGTRHAARGIAKAHESWLWDRIAEPPGGRRGLRLARDPAENDLQAGESFGFACGDET